MRIIHPGRGRLTLTLLFVVPAAMAYPWRAAPECWVLGVAAVAAVLLLGWWHGVHLTTLAARRLVLLTRNRNRDVRVHRTIEHLVADARTTVVLRAVDGAGDLPLDLIASYLDRYGVRCEAVRVTSRDRVSGRSIWIGLTMSAAANLAALQARSPSIPLRQTAELAARRLADQLRERGWTFSGSDLDIPDLLGPQARELWGSVADGSKGYLTVYGIAGGALAETLNSLCAAGFDEVWTAIEVSANGVAAACAIRGNDLPRPNVPVAGLVSRGGAQWDALRALIPTSTKTLGPPAFGTAELSEIRWGAGAVVVGHDIG